VKCDICGLSVYDKDEARLRDVENEGETCGGCFRWHSYGRKSRGMGTVAMLELELHIPGA
jgi:hypothetical protein